MRGVLAVGLMCVCVLGVMVTKTAAQGRGRGQVAATNLQVLPKDMPRPQLTAMMRSFTVALGVQCTHCHTGTVRERAKDDLPTKATARKMLQMTMAINNELLMGVGVPAEPGVLKVTCFTCHQGSLKPLTQRPVGGGH